jgi:hypothetical protein
VQNEEIRAIAELQFATGMVAGAVARTFIDSPRFWVAAEGDDDSRTAAAWLVPFEGRARAVGEAYITIARVERSRAAARGIDARALARSGVVQMASMVLWGTSDAQTVEEAREAGRKPAIRERGPQYGKKAGALNLLERMLAELCVAEGCTGHAPVRGYKGRAAGRPVCCDGHPSGRNIIESAARWRVKQLLEEALTVVEGNAALLAEERLLASS